MATVIRGSDNFDTSDNATQTELDALVTGKVLQISSIDTISGGLGVSESTTQLGSISYLHIAPSSKMSVTITKQSATSNLVCLGFISYKYTGGSGLHGMTLWTGTSSNYVSLGHDPYRLSWKSSSSTYFAVGLPINGILTGIGAGSVTINSALTRTTSTTVGYDINSGDFTTNPNIQSHFYVMEVEV